MRKTILFSFLIFLATSATIDVSSLANIDEVHQTHLNISLNVNFDNQQITGSNEINFISLVENLTEVVLDALDIKIIAVVDDKRNDLPFKSKGSTNKFLGTGVSIDVSSLKLKKGEKFVLKLGFQTPKLKGQGAVDPNTITSGILWLEADATISKQPFFFTQCEAALCRSIFPCQDTPAVKTTFEVFLKMKNTFTGLASGLLTGKVSGSETTTFHYEQRNKVPSYLIALAGGAIEYRAIGPKTGVYGEKDIVDKAKKCFEDLESYVNNVADYIGNYDWREYNILVLPLGFPFGGMENPSMTFATPSIVTGDKSLNNVAIHEIAHSWTGNTVTNTNWSHFWLNEGFTVFLERKGVEKSFDKDLMEIQEALGWNELKKQVEELGADNDLTKLITNMEGVNPDDSSTLIPYEKGYFFLRDLEKLVDSPTADENLTETPSNFQNLLRAWIANNKWQSRTTYDFQNHFESWVKINLPTRASQIIADAKFNERTTTPGMPPVDEPSNNATKAIIANAENYLKPNEVVLNLLNYDTSSVIYYFLKLSDIKNKENEMEPLFTTINTKYKISEKNDEIKFSFYLWSLTNSYDNIVDQVVEFLGTTGRMKYLMPLYKGLNAIDHQKALDTLAKYRKAYHSLAVQRLEKILNSTKEKIE